jgi:hypothetical protein
MKTQNHKRLLQNILFIGVLSMMSFTLYGVDAPVTTVGTTCNAVPGQPVTVPITVTGFNDIGSFYLTLEYYSSQLVYSSESKNPALLGSFVISNSNIGGGINRIIMTWSGDKYGTTLPDGSSIVDLVFNFISGPAELKWNISRDYYCQYTDPDVILLADSPKSSFYINGIVSASSAVTPTITPDGPTTFCEGSSVILTSSPGAAYQWSNGATTQSITVTTTGNYTVTLTDAEGCSATSDVMGVTVKSQTEEPATECWETATWNATTCSWDISGTQPAEPTDLECWETATFNNTTCMWDVSGTKPTEPTDLECWETAIFNTTTCVWDVSGTKPAEPTDLECWETAYFNNTT